MNVKKCCHCKEDLSLDCFQKNRAAPDGLQYRCKKCTRKASKDCRAKRGHLWKDASRLWKRNNKEKVNAAHRAQRARHPERTRKENRLWRERNPYSMAVKVAKDRAQELNVYSSLTIEEWKEIVNQANFICHLCGKAVSFEIGSPERLSLDHLIPMSRGGCNIKENVAPAHRRCNQNRTDMFLDEFDFWLKQVSEFRSNKNGGQSKESEFIQKSS